jgi:two-component system invasion response regulator UvrY
MVILIAGDQPVARMGLREALRAGFVNAEFIEAGDANEVLELLSRNRCDLLLLDVNMPGRRGFEILEDVRRLCPRLPIVMLSVFPEEQYALQSLRAGAYAYLSKDVALQELVAVVRKVLSGKRYISAHLAEALALSSISQALGPPHDRLSSREFEVLCMIAEGKPLSEVGRELHLSVKTVSTYRSRLLEKMNMRSNSELIRYALEHKLII